MAKKTWEQRKADRREARRDKQKAWLAHNIKHMGLLPSERSKLPRPKKESK